MSISNHMFTLQDIEFHLNATPINNITRKFIENCIRKKNITSEFHRNVTNRLGISEVCAIRGAERKLV